MIKGRSYQIKDIDARKGELVLDRSVSVRSGDEIDIDYRGGGTSRQRGAHGFSKGGYGKTYELLEVWARDSE